MASLEADLAETRVRVSANERNIQSLWTRHNKHVDDTAGRFSYIIDTTTEQYRDHIEKNMNRIRDEFERSMVSNVQNLELKMDGNISRLANEITSKLTTKFEGKIEQKTGWTGRLVEHLLQAAIVSFFGGLSVWVVMTLKLAGQQ